ncbi:flagellar basal-body MS-ring/collar protein FliF [Azonexus sp.]|jgi:flagellar M-ring protein FliF|uniref:flagellar basal-body MS-ring/collar protein FliF n=1 Tax=Azonexus sp. TaxID=1872668 RepID=UPI002823CB64|nr:flagellar basal-body MS-ring/collar protein FliF [Azonexus sp.]MDR1995078.1 flagellar M-ring protein FliF [Azonexus sp.]
MAATTETTAGTAPGGNPAERLRAAFNRLTEQQKIIFLVGLAAVVAIIVGAILWSRQPDWKVLFSNLSEKDGGTIAGILEAQNVPHRYSDNGALLVPADRVHEVRLRLASQGLPRGGLVGFELMENQKFGTSQFAEQVNYQRGLEGELARTIQSIGAVQAARVHLAIPKPSVFVRDDQKPSASVMLNLYPGRTLDGGQIAGISHLISSSVANLPLTNVTVIDQNGNLLTQLKSATAVGLDAVQLKYVREIEDGIIQRIETILKPVLGADNVKVQVAADLDFSHHEQTAETFRPNPTPESSTIRSQQTNEAANVNQPVGGVPGALTNQPPVPATAPLTQPNIGGVPGQLGQPGQPPGEEKGRIEIGGISAPLANHVAPPLSTNKNTTINYEVDKTIRYTKQAMGEIRRLSAAVVVNHRKEIGKDGKPVSRPLPEPEMKQINELIREAMGFSGERGDTLSVANAPFTETVKTEDSLPLWKDPENISYVKDIVKILIIAAIVALLYFKIIQPSLRTMFPPPPEEEDATAKGGILGEEDEEGVEVHLDNYTVKLQKARDIAQSDPKAVANIIRDWMGSNG